MINNVFFRPLRTLLFVAVALAVFIMPANLTYAKTEVVEESPQLPLQQTSYNLSDIPMLTSQAGWGPVEINSSVGEASAGDGQTMSINGQTFSHGFGTHAVSVISFDLEGKCSSLSSWVGIDDEVGSNGAAIFKVFADGQLLYNSGMLTGSDGAANTGSLDISGTNELMLIVEDAGLFYSDHANWAEPVVSCSSFPNGDGSSFKHIRGSWGDVLNWPVKAIHASLLPSGHILSHASADPGFIGSNDPNAPHNSTKVDLSNINNWSHEWVDHNSEEMYCSAHTLLQDGSVFEFGGHGGANPDFLYYGQDQASRFDFPSKTWVPMADMQQARWYPTAITLGSGEVMAIGGSHAAGNSFKPEIFDGNSWRLLNDVSYQDRLNNNEVIFDHTYPFAHLVSDGRIFWAGWDENMAYINPSGNGSWSQNYFRESQQRAWGSPIMYRIDKLLLVGGVDHQGNYGLATNTVKHIDLTGGTPSTTDTSPMLFPRADVDGTLLANGDVMVNGGGYEHILDTHPTHIYVPETWDPATGGWTVGAAATNPRGYHSTSLLLPDGRVWTGGGECGWNCDKGKTAQVYTPPYLYKQDGSGQLADRPSINSIPGQINYGNSFSANISTSNGVSKVTLLRLGSSTHHINFEQRYLELGYQQSGSTLNITPPAHGNLAPPGFYMLFVLDNAGVPS
ncbi:MAG: NPCBM/NEW2 domain-containing protein [Chloroflexota bacterium]